MYHCGFVSFGIQTSPPSYMYIVRVFFFFFDRVLHLTNGTKYQYYGQFFGYKQIFNYLCYRSNMVCVIFVEFINSNFEVK